MSRHDTDPAHDPAHARTKETPVDDDQTTGTATGTKTAASPEVPPALPAKERPAWIGAVIMPLFFILAFVTAYVSAMHAPVPHDLAIRVAGPTSAVQQIRDGIEERAATAFDVRTSSADAARRAVSDRDAVGALLVGPGAHPVVTVVVASGGGVLAVQAVQQLGAQAAEALDGTVGAVDVAPLAQGDGSGSVLFYLIVLCTVGGFLTMQTLVQQVPRARQRTKVLTALAASVLTPPIGFAVMAFSVGAYGAPFGSVVALLGVAMLYTLTVALLFLLFSELIGSAAIFAMVVLTLALNFPSTGGSIPESMLPAPWQAVHAVWFGSGALETFRSLVYFGGDGFAWPFVRLLMWLVAVALLLVAVLRRKATSNAPALRDGTLEPTARGVAEAIGAGV